MMGSLLRAILLLLLVRCFYCLQLCTDSRAPFKLMAPLDFCGYNGSSCCSAKDDSAIKKQFESMNVSDAACASLIQSILCAKCDPFSANLFTVEPKIRTVPVLCNSTFLATSSQSSRDTTRDFCAQVWDTCKDASMWNSPFAPLLQGSTGAPVSSSKITDFWQSESDFCKAFGGSSNDQSVCFNGRSALFNITPDSPSPKGICLERIGNGSYLSMSPHPDGSNRVFLANQEGKIWLAKLPKAGSGGTLEIDESRPFLDISDEVLFDADLGMMDVAFHPNFTSNGRFFVSYNCDKVQSRSCSGRCSCNSDADCDPSKLGTSNGVQPCQYQSVISEFTANSSSSPPSTATSANPYEVRRILTMGLPFTNNHGGEILFGPEDGYLYCMMGDGGNKGDPFNFAQNKKSLLGKVLRLDVDKIPSQSKIDDLGPWGNYSIPEDNPFADDSEFQPEIWALGLRNPWRCSFDSGRPSYFFCGDTGQDTYEEINLISKGGNYGWRVYEGADLFHPHSTTGGDSNASVPSNASINAIFPIMGYLHSALNNSVGSGSVTGGYVYRSTTDPCMFGRYVFADLYAGAMWVGTESPQSSGNYSSTMIPFSCSDKSPIPCDSDPGSNLPSVGYIFSFGEDNNRDVYIMTSKGIYKIVHPSRCNYSCPKDDTTDNGNAPPDSSSASYNLEDLHAMMKHSLSMLLLLLLLLSS